MQTNNPFELILNKLEQIQTTVDIISVNSPAQKTLPKEVLFFTATLNHMAANMNQIAHKRNCNDELNAIERAELNVLSQQVKQLVNDIKSYLQ